MTKQEMLEQLNEFDTPSITNVVATYPGHPLCLGLYNPWTEDWYTDQSVRCMYPELGRTVGHAVTVVYGLPDPNYSQLTFMDVVDALDASPKPTVLILEQKFPPEIAGKVGLAGGNMTAAMKAVGCLGVISNGPSRDLPHNLIARQSGTICPVICPFSSVPAYALLTWLCDGP